MFYSLYLICGICLINSQQCYGSIKLVTNSTMNSNELTIGLSQIIHNLPTNYKYIAILILNNCTIKTIDGIIKEIYLLPMKICVFVDYKEYIEFLSNNIQGSMETATLIFSEIYYALNEVS